MQLYLSAHQSRERAPTVYEDLLADGIEKAYAAGVHDLDGIVAQLRVDCVPAPGGVDWTPDLLVAELKRLGA
jgi:hypothetical protein